ncbi:YciC family protein [Sodalis endosymbiont of Henestaris halophilus]|uniref:YciC family protein n=1 Tax=Sodalis endosymbiont of Henestaris halophilus TaxID=1929246 RepID=UPI000BBFE163|nr:YciC family protein [Sodalis endosymbiont of Henestaris halophilus]SNC58752.1 Membrane protein YciC linked to IspA [Sodalis endosymbiont of Henestaris halophilus]
MPIIIANTVYRDMLYFFRNQFTSIVMLAILTALISVILKHMLSPDSQQLIALNNSTYISDITDINLQQLVRHISAEQQCILLQASAAKTLAILVGNVILVAGLLTMINLISNNQSVSVLRAISLSIPLLPRLLVLIFLITLLVQLGLLLIIVPGVLLAIAFSLAPIIATRDNLSTIKSMHISTKMAFTNVRLLAPAVLFWLLAKAVVLLLMTQCTFMSLLIAEILLNGLSNLISALLLIYLYRLYMLLPQN